MDMNEEYGLTPYETREILFYKTDNGEVRVEILLYQENLWLTQAKMAVHKHSGRKQRDLESVLPPYSSFLHLYKSPWYAGRNGMGSNDLL